MRYSRFSAPVAAEGAIVHGRCLPARRPRRCQAPVRGSGRRVVRRVIRRARVAVARLGEADPPCGLAARSCRRDGLLTRPGVDGRVTFRGHTSSTRGTCDRRAAGPGSPRRVGRAGRGRRSACCRGPRRGRSYSIARRAVVSASSPWTSARRARSSGRAAEGEQEALGVSARSYRASVSTTSARSRRSSRSTCSFTSASSVTRPAGAARPSSRDTGRPTGCNAGHAVISSGDVDRSGLEGEGEVLQRRVAGCSRAGAA